MSSDRWHVDFPLRAHRPYVHSASICNHLRDRFGDATAFEITFKTWMDARVVFSADPETAPDEKGFFRITLPTGETARYGFTDDPGYPAVERTPYDEEGLVADAVVDGRTIHCAPGRGGSFFDRIVAANKVLINRTLNPGVKLIASKIAVAGFSPDDATFDVRLDSHVGTRIYKSSLWTGDVKIGQVVYYGQ